jgi:hypothetical protein
MRLLRRLALVVVVLTFLTGVVLARPGLFGLSSPEEVAAQQRKEQLDRMSEIVKERMDAKRRVIGELLEDRLNLMEAARWFKELNERPEDCQDRYRVFYPAPSAGESLCRQVLTFVRAELKSLPRSQAESLMSKLEGELCDHLRRHDGIVVLPE